MILLFTRQPEVGAKVASYVQLNLGWRAVACARRPTMDLPFWRYHLDALAGECGDAILYGWTLLNALIEETPVLPPNFLRRWCREFLVRGGVIFHVEPTLPEFSPEPEDFFGLSERELSEAVGKERELRQRYREFLAGFHGLPASLILSLDEDEMMLRIREADSFFQRSRRYEAAENRRYGGGSLVPRIVVVGEAPTPCDPFAPPFGALGGSSAYLGELLDAAGLQEGELHFLNAASFRGEPAEHAVIGLLRPEVLLLLGRQAAQWWEKREHYVDSGALGQLGVVRFEHPQYLKRFHFDKLDDHARRLVDALERVRSGERAVDARLVPDEPPEGDSDEAEAVGD